MTVSAMPPSSRAAAVSGAGDGFAASMADIFDDLFGDVMGRRGGGRGSARERGSDLRYNIEITLEEAFHGKTATLKVPTSISCEACGGTGAKKGSKPKTCPTCGGHGRVRAQQGFFAIERTCPTCQGRGEIIDNPCPVCAGTGRVTIERTLSVNMPAGVEDGTRIRLAGEGEAGLRGGPSGDLYIFLSVKPHSFFQRDGADLYLPRADLDGARRARRRDHRAIRSTAARPRSRFPRARRPASRSRSKARACPSCARATSGDLYVQISVETPQNLTKRQRELLNEFEEESSHQTHPEATGFFAKMKELFGK